MGTAFPFKDKYLLFGGPGNLSGPFTPVSWDSERRQAQQGHPTLLKCLRVGTGSSVPSFKLIMLKNWQNAMGSRERAQFMFIGRTFY